MGVRWGYTLALYHRGEWEGPGLWGNPGVVRMGVWDEEEGFWAGKGREGTDEELGRRLRGAFRALVGWWRKRLAEAREMSRGKASCWHPDIEFWRVRTVCLPRWRAMRARGRKEREERRAQEERRREVVWERWMAAGPKWAKRREFERRMEGFMSW